MKFPLTSRIEKDIDVINDISNFQPSGIFIWAFKSCF